MTILIVGAAAIIAVVIIAVTLSRRRPQRAGRHAARGAWADDVPADNDGDDTAAFFAAERPGEIAREPEFTHEEFLPAPLAEAPAYPPPEFADVPVAGAPVSPRRVRAQVLPRVRLPRKDRPILPPMVAGPALAVAASLAAMAQRVAATDRREIVRLRVANQQLQREVAQLRPAGQELQQLREEKRALQDQLDFPHLFDEGIQYSDWDWKTDSGILRLRAAAPATADKAAA